MESADKKCLYCGKTLRGRVDKKFCDDACRNNYNNELNSDANNLVRNINNALRKNRRILKDLMPDSGDATKVKQELLSRKGFQSKYHTHEYETQKGQVYYFCYEYGYLKIDEQQCLIVKQKSELKEEH